MGSIATGWLDHLANQVGSIATGWLGHLANQVGSHWWGTSALVISVT